jgi:hypothetical protein
MKQSKFYLMLLLITFTIAFSFVAQFVVSHETIHQLIYDDYNITSEIKYNLNPFSENMGMTLIDSSDDVKCTTNCQLAQEINEIIGYNSQIFLYLAFFLVFIFLMIKMNDSLEDNK